MGKKIHQLQAQSTNFSRLLCSLSPENRLTFTAVPLKSLQDSPSNLRQDVVAVAVVAYLCLTVPKLRVSWPGHGSGLTQAAYEDKPRVCTSLCSASCLELQRADLEEDADLSILLLASKGTHFVDLRKAVRLRGWGRVGRGGQGVGMERTRFVRGSWVRERGNQRPKGNTCRNLGCMLFRAAWAEVF